MLEATPNSARAWTAPDLWRFEPAPSNNSAPFKLRTFSPHYPFISSILQNETLPQLGWVSLPGAGRGGLNKIMIKIKNSPMPIHPVYRPSANQDDADLVVPYFGV